LHERHRFLLSILDAVEVTVPEATLIGQAWSHRPGPPRSKRAERFVERSYPSVAELGAQGHEEASPHSFDILVPDILSYGFRARIGYPYVPN